MILSGFAIKAAEFRVNCSRHDFTMPLSMIGDQAPHKKGPVPHHACPRTGYTTFAERRSDYQLKATSTCLASPAIPRRGQSYIFVSAKTVGYGVRPYYR